MKKFCFYCCAMTAAMLFTAACDNDIDEGEITTGLTVTVTASEGGTATADVTTAEPGDKITLTAVPDEGFELVEWVVESGGITLENPEAPVTSFIMARENVCIHAEFMQATDNVLDAVTDSVFKKYCTYRMEAIQADAEGKPRMPWDENGDGKLSSMEAAAVDWIDLSHTVASGIIGEEDRIEYLAGIEYFTGLTYLNCEDHSLTELNVTKSTGLTYLNLNLNFIESIDLSSNTALEELYLEQNMLTKIDVSKCTELKVLSIYANDISTIDVSDLQALESLRLTYNQNLSAIDVSKNTELVSLEANFCDLTSLDLTSNTKLEKISVSRNRISTLNIGECPELTTLACGNNMLTELDVTGFPKLTNLQFPSNKITSIDLSNCTELYQLYAYDNELTVLDISRNNKLLYCQVFGNHLDEFDATSMVMLWNEETQQFTNAYDLWCGDQRKEGMTVEDNTYINPTEEADKYKQVKVKIRCDQQEFWDSNLYPGFNARNHFVTLEHSDCDCGLSSEDINRNNTRPEDYI